MPEFHAEWGPLRDLEVDARSARFEIDMRPLGPEVERILQEENTRARLDGVGRDGTPLEPIRESTVDRRQRQGKGDGPPLAPDRERSRVVANHLTEATSVTPEHLSVRAFWVGVPWLRDHADGTVPHTPARDVIGLTPDADAYIGDVFREFVRLRTEEALDRGFFGRTRSRLASLLRR